MKLQKEETIGWEKKDRVGGEEYVGSMWSGRERRRNTEGERAGERHEMRREGSKNAGRTGEKERDRKTDKGS